MQARFERRGIEPGHRRQRFEREALAEHGRVLDQGPIGRIKVVEARCDECGQRLRHGQFGQVPHRDVHPRLLLQAALRDQHSDRLDCVERHAVGPRHDGPRGLLGEAGDQPTKQFPHGPLGKRFEVDRGEVALARAPVRSPLDQLRAGQGHDAGSGVRWLHSRRWSTKSSVPRVGPVQVLEGEHHRPRVAESLEEGAPGREQLLGAGVGSDAQQGEQGALDPAPARRASGTCRARIVRDLRPGGGLVIGLGQPAAGADHLAQGPEGDPLAVGGAAAVVPPDVVHQPVEVLEEFPGEAALADPRRTDHRKRGGSASRDRSRGTGP